MGKRTFTSSDQYYTNLLKMMKEYSIPHEGNPDVSLEMIDMLYQKNDFTKEVYERISKMISDGLMAHEGGHAKYETLINSE